MTSMPSQTLFPFEFSFKSFANYSKPVLQATLSFISLLLIHFTISIKLPKILNDAGMPEIETERIQIFLLIGAITTPIMFLSIKKYFPDYIATKRKLIIMGLTTVIVSIQLLLGAVMLKRSVEGFEINFRLSISLKSLCFVIISALSVGPFMIHGMYSDAISSQCSERVNPYFLSNMGCALIRFFTLLPIIIVCALFNKPEEYVSCFAALLPLLSINLMAYALEQPPRIHLVANNERNNDDAESQF